MARLNPKGNKQSSGAKLPVSTVQLYRRLYEESLRNAKRWIEDARLLMQSSSYGHASALLRFAGEETAKAIVCWYVSERIWPENSKPVKDVFRFHVAKNQVLLGMLLGIQLRMLAERGLIKTAEPTDQEIARQWKIFERLTCGMEEKRKRAIYVDLNPRDRTIDTPENVGEEEVKGILEGAEFVFAYAKDIARVFPESVRQKFRQYFKSLPKEVWDTGNIPLD